MNSQKAGNTSLKENMTWKAVRSAACAVEVGLGLFPSNSLEIQSYDFDGIAHAGAPLGVKFYENRIKFLRNLRF